MSARFAGLAGLIALTLGVTAPATAQGQGVLTLVDRRLSPGAVVSLSGAQFSPGAALTLILDGAGGRAALGFVTAGPGGAFGESLRVPATLAPGAYRLEARARGAIVASLDVAVLADTSASAAPANPAAAPAPMAGMPHDTAAPMAGGMSPGTAAPMAEGMKHAPAASGAAAADSGAAAAQASEPGTGAIVLGSEWPQLHAALNDLPAALLLAAVLFEIVGLISRKPSFRAAGFWTLLLGAGGTVGAVVAGLMAERVAEHDDVAHVVMQRHKVLGLVTLAVFVLLTIWRVARRKSENRREQTAWTLAAMAGAGLLIATSNVGGSLIFDHALGVPSAILRQALERRGELPATLQRDSAATDTTAAPGARPHRDAPGAAPHSHSKRPAQP